MKFQEKADTATEKTPPNPNHRKETQIPITKNKSKAN